MTLHIEIFNFSNDHAHGSIILDNQIEIPISMPIQSYETAVENKLLLPHEVPASGGVVESTLFLSPSEIK